MIAARKPKNAKTLKDLALALKSVHRKLYRPRAKNETNSVWRMLVERRATRLVLQTALRRTRIAETDATGFLGLVKLLAPRIKSKNYAKMLCCTIT